MRGCGDQLIWFEGHPYKCFQGPFACIQVAICYDTNAYMTRLACLSVAVPPSDNGFNDSSPKSLANKIKRKFFHRNDIKTGSLLKFSNFFLYSEQGARCGSLRKFHADWRIFRHCLKSAKIALVHCRVGFKGTVSRYFRLLKWIYIERAPSRAEIHC